MASSNDNFDFKTRNYPPENDTTSSGGFSAANPWSAQNQRRADHADARDTAAQFAPANTSLLSQAPGGGALADEVQDARQGADVRAREAFAHEAARDFDGAQEGRDGGVDGHAAMNPYWRNPDSREEMEGRLAGAYADQRGRRAERWA